MLIFFRLDVSPEIGVGHLRRCVTLAEAVRKKGGELAFLIKSRGIANEQLHLPEGSILEEVPWHVSPDEDARLIIDWCLRHGCRSGVVDHYNQPTSYQAALIDAGILWMQFANSMLNHPLGANLLHDASPEISQEDYPSDRFLRSDHRFLFGPGYALVSENFRRARSSATEWRSRGKILLTFGGGDDRGAALAVLDWLDHADWPGARVVLSTSFNPHLPALRERSKLIPNVELIVDDWAPAPRMVECRIAFCAGGTTLYELATLGVPSFVVTIAENQLGPARSWQTAGFGRNLGCLDSMSAESFAAAIQGETASPPSLQNWSARCWREFDGEGAARTAEALLALPVSTNR